MTSYLLDTTVHVHWIRNSTNVFSWLDAAARRGDEILTSTISVAEVYTRAHERELQAWLEYFAGMKLVPVGPEEAVTAGRLRYNLARRGLQLHLPDALIAATAVRRRAAVVTANPKDFQPTGVEVFPLLP